MINKYDCIVIGRRIFLKVTFIDFLNDGHRGKYAIKFKNFQMTLIVNSLHVPACKCDHCNTIYTSHIQLFNKTKRNKMSAKRDENIKIEHGGDDIVENNGIGDQANVSKEVFFEFIIFILSCRSF